MTRILKNKRRGFILATCFGAMSMVMMISTLLVLMMRTDIAKQRVEDKTTVMYSTLDEIGAKFVAGNLGISNLSEPYNGTYYCQIDGLEDGKQRLTVSASQGGEPMLVIVIDTSDNAVITWKKNY